MSKRFSAVFACLSAGALMMSQVAAAQTARLAEFSGDAATAPADLVTAAKLEALRGTRTVIIPQFTVEYVLQSDGLTDKEERRQDYVKVDYRVDAPDDAVLQAMTDALYKRWTDGLQAQGLTVLGPQDAAARSSWSKVAAKAKPAPATIQRKSGVLMIYSVSGSNFLMPVEARDGPPTGNAAALSGAADTGAAVASRMGGKLGGMFGMARGLAKLGGGLKGFGNSAAYLTSEPKLAKEAEAAVMTVRLVVGLRDTDMASRGFGAFRTASSYDGKPRLVVQSEGTAVTITTAEGQRATLGLTRDLVFAEDLFAGKVEVANSTSRSIMNMVNRARFVTVAVGGGSASIDQTHIFAATAEPAAYEAAVTRNLSAVEDMLLARTKGAW